MAEDLVERVLRAVDLVPAGRVVSYGDIAALVGTGPRRVGAVMSAWGSSVTWWRVTSASGDLPPDLAVEASAHWRDEGITIKPSGRGCRIGAHRADLARWADAYDASLGASAGAELLERDHRTDQSLDRA
ncbi:MGMT family protein [Aestuariimicrobium kwangyangense]|uniref:MGMT family protein n=1 Tax=Aestuariimicrobium kwangyangense TaxID=396389 RepID=UPI0003B56A38|nr:MGMT family protein [Aestuariimicrobium kwangyangense]